MDLLLLFTGLDLLFLRFPTRTAGFIAILEEFLCFQYSTVMVDLLL